MSWQRVKILQLGELQHHLRGWARSASGDTAGGLAWIEDGLRHWRATAGCSARPFLLALKAEALHLCGRTSEALETIKEAEALVERSGARYWFAELHRLRGAFLTAIGADETQIEASFLRSHQNRTGAAVDFARETRRGDIRRIPPPKSEWVRRTWSSTTLFTNLLSPLVEPLPASVAVSFLADDNGPVAGATLSQP